MVIEDPMVRAQEEGGREGGVEDEWPIREMRKGRGEEGGRRSDEV